MDAGLTEWECCSPRSCSDSRVYWERFAALLRPVMPTHQQMARERFQFPDPFIEHARETPDPGLIRGVGHRSRAEGWHSGGCVSHGSSSEKGPPHFGYLSKLADCSARFAFCGRGSLCIPVEIVFRDRCSIWNRSSFPVAGAGKGVSADAHEGS